MTLAWRTVRWRFASETRDAVIVEARGADGARGLGEAAPLPGRSRETIADVERALAELSVPELASVDAVWHATREVRSPAARFAVETALLGVLAERAGCDLARLICDAAPREVATAIVVADADAARRAWEAGARCLKVKVGGDLSAISAAAPGATLRLDANRAWPAGEVVARMAGLRGLPIDFVEEPCADLAQLIGTRLALPVALDESLADTTGATLDALLGWPQVGALVVKPTILGGIARCRELAARVSVPVIVSHALEGPIGTAACAELARALAGECVRGLVRPAGVGAHPALAGWSIAPPQVHGHVVRRADKPGLGFAETLDLARAIGSAP